MRKLSKTAPPPQLEADHDELVAAYARSEVTSPWRREDVKDALLSETGGRCAYCNSDMHAVSYPEIEHIKPKSRFPGLIVQWDNLTIACSRCNRKKLNYYEESAPIVNPYVDDPRDYLRFFGDMVLPVPGSTRGRVTVIRLDLKRWDLQRARARRIDDVAALVDEWATSDIPGVKSTLEQFIQEDLDEGEYYEHVRAFLISEDFPVAPDRVNEMAG